MFDIKGSFMCTKIITIYVPQERKIKTFTSRTRLMRTVAVTVKDWSLLLGTLMTSPPLLAKVKPHQSNTPCVPGVFKALLTNHQILQLLLWDKGVEIFKVASSNFVKEPSASSVCRFSTNRQSCSLDIRCEAALLFCRFSISYSNAVHTAVTVQSQCFIQHFWQYRCGWKAYGLFWRLFWTLAFSIDASSSLLTSWY